MAAARPRPLPGGQPRGRHGPARRPTIVELCRAARRPGARGRLRRLRSPPARPRRARRRPGLGERPQARRAPGDRRPGGAPGRADRASPRGRRAGAAPGERAWRTSRASSASVRPPAALSAGDGAFLEVGAPPVTPADRRHRRGRRSAVDGVAPRGCTGPRGPAPPSGLPWRRAGSRPSPSCSDSTGAASPPTRGRRARRSRSSPLPCSRPWVSTPATPCVRRWVGRPPMTTSTPSSRPSRVSFPTFGG